MNDWNIYSPENRDMDVRLRRLERGRQTLRRGNLVSPSSNYSLIPSDVLVDGRVDLTGDAGFDPKGAISPFGIVGNFGFSATDTSISIYWDGTNTSNIISLIRANGEVVRIPTGSKTITGLTASTPYAFLPYWSVFNDCGIGWIVGDAGSPQFAFTAAAMDTYAVSKQSRLGREQLSPGFITFSTAAPAGTIAPGPATGGGSRCVMLGTDIEPLGNAEYTTKHYPQSDWIRILAAGNPRMLNCTPDHRLYHADKGKIRADEFVVDDWIITEHGEKKIVELEPFTRVCTKVEVVMQRGHLFWANGFMSHNVKSLDENVA
jgi:hypothetical protein